MTVPNGTPVWFDQMSPQFDRTTAFYGTLFGWHVPAGLPEFGGYTRATVAGRDVAGLCPTMPGMEDAPCVWTTYLASDNIEQHVSAAVAAGGQVLSPPMRIGDLGSMAVLLDPTGAAFGLWQADGFAGARFDGGTVGAPCWVECVSQDFEAAKRFYANLFDLSLSSDEPGGEGEYAMATPAGASDHAFGIFGFPDGVPETAGSYWMTYLAVDDVDATAARAAELGGSILVDPVEVPGMGRWANLTGLNGEQFGIFQKQS